jgi:hypothetical protein
MVRNLITQRGLAITGEGVVGGETIAVKNVAELPSKEAFSGWFEGLEDIFSA